MMVSNVGRLDGRPDSGLVRATLLIAVALFQLGVFAWVVGVWGPSEATAGVNVVAFLEFVTPLLVFALGAGTGWIVRRRLAARPRGDVLWWTTAAVHWAMLALLSFQAVATPLLLPFWLADF